MLSLYRMMGKVMAIDDMLVGVGVERGGGVCNRDILITCYYSNGSLGTTFGNVRTVVTSFEYSDHLTT